MSAKPFLRTKAEVDAFLESTSLALGAVREFVIRPSTSLGDNSEEQKKAFEVVNALHLLNTQLDEVRANFAQLNIKSYADTWGDPSTIKSTGDLIAKKEG